MSLGILNNISAIYAGNNLNNTQASLQKVLQQLSSGARINSGADDAAGLAIADGLKANEASLTQSVQNASDGVGLLQTADGALSQVTNLLDRAVTLATEAANGTLSTNQVSSANQEYQSIVTEIGNIGSTTNFNGNSVFGSGTTSFYVGDGTATGSNFYSDSVGSLTQTSVGITAPVAASTNVAAPAVTAGVAGTSGTILTYTVANANDTVAGTLSVFLGSSNTTSADSITFAAGTSLTSAKNQINASTVLHTTDGITATVVGNTLVLTGASALSTTTNALADASSSLKDTQSTVQLAAPANTASTTSAAGHVDFAALQNPNTDTLVGTLVVKQGSGATVTAQFAQGTTLAAAVTQLNNNASFKAANLTASSAAGVLRITGIQDATVSGTNTLSTTGTTLFNAPPTALPGAGTDFTASAISTLTTASAQTVLTSLNSAIANVAYQRGIIGADSNELTAASNTAASENVNLTAAESSIRSTNYGQATSDLAKYEVLSQTGISALAQANTVQQEILKLLQ